MGKLYIPEEPQFEEAAEGFSFGIQSNAVPYDNLNFGQAIVALRNGQKLKREGWGHEGYVTVMPAGGRALIDGAQIDLADCMGFVVPGLILQPGWTPTQNDMLADDWAITSA